jgi:hypothetical protein
LSQPSFSHQFDPLAIILLVKQKLFLTVHLVDILPQVTSANHFLHFFPFHFLAFKESAFHDVLVGTSAAFEAVTAIIGVDRVVDSGGDEDV